MCPQVGVTGWSLIKASPSYAPYVIWLPTRITARRIINKTNTLSNKRFFYITLSSIHVIHVAADNAIAAVAGTRRLQPRVPGNFVGKTDERSHSQLKYFQLRHED